MDACAWLKTLKMKCHTSVIIRQGLVLGVWVFGFNVNFGRRGRKEPTFGKEGIKSDGCFFRSLKLPINEATTELCDKNVQEPTESHRKSRRRSSKRFRRRTPRSTPTTCSKRSITPETSLTTLNLMEKDIKKLVLGDCEVTDAGCRVVADVVKVNDTIEELDLPDNTNSALSVR